MSGFLHSELYNRTLEKRIHKKSRNCRRTTCSPFRTNTGLSWSKSWCMCFRRKYMLTWRLNQDTESWPLSLRTCAVSESVATRCTETSWWRICSLVWFRILCWSGMEWLYCGISRWLHQLYASLGGPVESGMNGSVAVALFLTLQHWASLIAWKTGRTRSSRSHRILWHQSLQVQLQRRLHSLEPQHLLQDLLRNQRPPHQMEICWMPLAMWLYDTMWGS